jgi:hypothetical protein
MSHSRSVTHQLVAARLVEQDKFMEFAARVWPWRPRERILDSWWLRAAPECAVAAIAGGRMVGLCAGRPSEWMIDGRAYAAVAICDWYISPDHQGKLLGRRLVRQFEAPDRILSGFSISEVAINYLSRLGWVGPYQSTLMALPLPGLARLPLALLKPRGDLDFEHHEVGGGGSLGALAPDLEKIESSRMRARAHMRRGAAEWSWRLSVCGERRYRFCVARRAGAPIGYVVVRAMIPGASRMLGRLQGAIVTDLVAVDDDVTVLRALAVNGVELAAGLGARVVLAVTTSTAHRRALTATGFLSSGFPLLGPRLQRRAPVYMWLPKGPAATLSSEKMDITFADADVDLAL